MDIAGIEDIYELSPLQQGMLLQCLYAPESDAQINQAVIDFEGTLDPAAARAALEVLVARHPVLRTSFAWEDLDQPFQIVHRIVNPALSFEDWSELSEAERAQRLEMWLARDRAAGFDLGTAPLLRVALLKIDERRQRLVWTFHHIVLEGLSFTILLGEFWRLIETPNVTGSVLTAPPPAYATYIRWLQKQDRTKAERYWKRALQGLRAATHLPIDLAGPGKLPSGTGIQSVSLLLAESLSAALREFAARNRVTLNTVVQGAWALLLSRYTAEEDVVFGVVVSGRPAALERSQSMVGLFVNALPARVSVTGSRPISEWLQALQADQVEMRQYDFSAMTQVQGWSGVPRGQPLFESLLIFENWYYDRSALQVGGDRAVRGISLRKGSDQPLTLDVFATTKTFKLELLFEAARFDEKDMSRLLGHMRTLLEGFVADPNSPLSSLALITDDERAQFKRWNATQAEYPQTCLHTLFETQVERTPSAPAIVYGDITLSYGDLNVRANRLAGYLRSLGVGRGSRVGLCVERSAEMVVGMLGVLKAGGAYVPLDVGDPPARLSYMLADASVAALVTHAQTSSRFSSYGGCIVDLDVEANAISAAAGENLDVEVGPDDVAYVIYTSGSTGRPKGVMGLHRGAVNRLSWMWNAHPYDADERCCQKTTLSFVDSVSEIFSPLLQGIRLVVADAAAAKDPRALAALVSREGITRLVVVPSLMRALLGLNEAVLSGLECVRHWVTSGERLEPDLESTFRARFPKAVLLNLYGSSEVSADVTFFDTSERGERRGSLIGRPISNTRTYVLDSHMNAVPIGVPGELYVGGAGLARGYLDRADLTAERFIANPFREESDSRLYKMGDVVRYCADGVLEYLGRVDHQVKIRGHRIEIGEVEAALAGCPGVREAAVMAEGGDRLIAYYVALGEATVAVKDVREHLARTLPDYMVPSAYMAIDELPLTASGKVDRKALPAPNGERQVETEYVAPRTELEQRIAQIWREVLRVEKIGAHDNFFALGGHSLLAAQVLSRLRQALEVQLSLREFFAAPTVASLSERAEALRASPNITAGGPLLEASEDSGPTVLSFSQRRLWILDQLEPGGKAYVISAALELRGVLDASSLERALGAIVNRHDSLRTVFMNEHGEPLQTVVEPGPWELPIADLSGEENPHAKMEQLLHDEAVRGFDLASGPLFRAHLYRLAADAHVLMLAMHHIVSDGWSLGVLTRELGEFYGCFVRGERPAVPALRIQYRDFARWQRAWLKDEALASQIAHWRARLAGAPQVLDLPSDRARPRVESHRGASYPFGLPRGLIDRIHNLSRREGATLFMTLVSGFALLLSRYSGQRDLLVGTPVANRNRAEIEPLVGFFVNTLVLRANISENLSVREFLARMREECLQAFAYQDLPFERLVEELNPTRDFSRNPVFQVMFVLQNAPIEALELPGLTLKPVEADNGTAQVDLTLTVRETPKGLIGEFRYATDLFDASTIARLAEHWRRLLEAMAAAPESPIDHLPLLTDAERRQVVEDWNDTTSEYPRERCVHELFSTQAARTPLRVAVEHGGHKLSYGALDASANRLAQVLRTRGVRRGQRVGLCVERGADMLAAMLAILKAGAAYVPLDPGYPRERLRFMAQDADLAALVSTAELASPFSVPRERLVLLDSDAASIAAAQASPLEVDANSANPEDAAYVIYTSGSTGAPKGVVVPHRAVVNFLTSMARKPGLTADDVLVAVTTLSFDIAVLELQLPLTLGATVVIARRDEVSDGYALKRLLESHRASVMQGTPTTWHLLLESGWRGRAGFKVLVGGEPLQKDLADRLIACGMDLWNMYGPTETTVWSTCARISNTNNEGITIGKPIANTTVRILDAQKNLCPIGVPGELYIGGEGLSLGYWNRPELTAERFIADPFSTVSGARLYRTGDRVRWRDDGTLEHLGRLDDQIKLRGYRIELGEIEATLSRHTAVRQAVVHAREDAPGDKRLVAYLVTGDAPADLDDQLRTGLRARLPEYMVPARFVRLDALPLTPNGKVDRKALPAPGERSRAEDNYLPPQTAYERELASIWCEVLGVDRISVQDNFFDIGGHSLLAIRAISMFKERTGRSIAPRDYYQQTLAQLAASVDETAGRTREHLSSRRITLEPFFFGADTRRMFGLFRFAPSPRDIGVVLCQPHAHEYIRCHRAFRELGQRLAWSGFHVLSFDYYGTGDSDGEYVQGGVSEWMADTALAIDVLKQKLKLERVSLLGLRLGATMAMMTAAGRNDIDGMALWDPIVQGSDADEEIARLLATQSLDPARQRDIEHPDVLSYPLTPKMMYDLQQINLCTAQFRSAPQLLIVETEAQGSGSRLASRVKTLGIQVDYRCIDESRVWLREPYESIVPQESLKTLVSWLSEIHR